MDATNCCKMEQWPLGVGRGARRVGPRVCRGGDGEVEKRVGITSNRRRRTSTFSRRWGVEDLAARFLLSVAAGLLPSVAAVASSPRWRRRGSSSPCGGGALIRRWRWNPSARPACRSTSSERGRRRRSTGRGSGRVRDVIDWGKGIRDFSGGGLAMAHPLAVRH